MNQMTPDGIAVTVKWLTRYCEVFRKEFTQTLFETYRDCLYDLSVAELELAFAEGMRRTRFFPNPAEVRDALDAALERMPRRREAVEDCPKCQGDGWKVIEKNGTKYAIQCGCRRKTG